MNSSRFRLLPVLIVLPALAACSATVRQPRLEHPGPAGYQRGNAVQFDPYPQNDMGPEIVGGRPLDYQKPPDEVTRARQHQPTGPWRVSGPLY